MAVIGLLALIAPLRAAERPLSRVGAVLALAGGLEVLHGVRRTEAAALRRAVTSGVITAVMGLLVINAPYVAGTALVLFLAVSFALDAVGDAGTARRSTERRARLLNALAASGNLAVAVLLLVVRQVSVTWLVAAAGALRIFGIAWTMATSPVHSVRDAGPTVIDDLGVEGDASQHALRDQLLAVAGRDDVRFVVISSDVVYPTVEGVVPMR